VNWTRKHTLIAGLGLIALTNAVALVGAAWNRSGEPEARLRLSQRELAAPSRWYGNRENSGVALQLSWRVLTETSPGGEVYAWRYYGRGGTPAWLDRAKMEALGFEVPARDSGRSRSRYDKQLAREVLLVLEHDGPTYRRALETITERAASEQAKLAALPGDKGLETRAKTAREALEWETSRSSRLFVVDAGLDAEALRARYPDRTRYAIVKGEVRPQAYADRDKARGYIDAIAVETINAPYELRGVFAGAMQVYDMDQRNKAPFEATVAWGRRLEPWLVEAARK
jgi:hypothetical protein